MDVPHVTAIAIMPLNEPIGDNWESPAVLIRSIPLITRVDP